MSAREITVSLKFVNAGLEKAAGEIKMLSAAMTELNKSFKGMTTGQIKAIMKALEAQGKKNTEVDKKQAESKKKLSKSWKDAIQVGQQAQTQMKSQMATAESYGKQVAKNLQRKEMVVQWDAKVLQAKRKLEFQQKKAIDASMVSEEALWSQIEAEEEFLKVSRTNYEMQEREAKIIIKKTAATAKLLEVSYAHQKENERRRANGMASIEQDKALIKLQEDKAAAGRTVALASDLVAESEKAVNKQATKSNAILKAGNKTIDKWVIAKKKAYEATKKGHGAMKNAWTGTQKFIGTLAGGLFTMNQVWIWFTRITRAAKWLYDEFVVLVQEYSELIRVSRSAAFILGSSTDSIIKAAAEVTLLGISMKDAAKGLDEFGRAGYKLNEAVSSYVPITMFARAANVELGRATTMVTGSMKAFGFEAKDVWRISNGMINAIYKSRNSFESLETAMSYAAAAGGAFGQEYEEVLATVSAFRDIGLQESTAGTAYRRSINQFAFISSAAKKNFESLGLDAEDFKLNALRSFNDVIRKLSDLKDTVSDVKLSSLVKDLVGKRFGAYVKRLVDATYEGAVSLETLTDRYVEDSKLLGAVTKNNMRHITNQIDVLGGVWDKMHTLVVGYASDFVNEYLAAFNFVVNTVLDSLLKKYGQVAKEFKKMDAAEMIKKFNEFEKAVNEKMTAIVLKFAEFRTAFASIAPVVDWVINSVKAFGLIIAAAVTGLVELTAVAGLAVSSMYSLGVGIGSTFKGMIRKTLYSLEFIAKNAMTEVNNIVVRSLMDLEKAMITLNIFDSLFSRKTILDNFTSLFKAILGLADKWSKSFSDWTGMDSIFGSGNLVKEFESSLALGSTAINALGGNAEKTGERIKKALAQVELKGGLKKTAITLKQYIAHMKEIESDSKAAFDDAKVTKFGTAMATLFDKSKGVADKILEAFANMPADADMASKAIDKLLGKLAKLMKDAKNLYKTSSPGKLVDKAVREKQWPTNAGDKKLMEKTANETRVMNGADLVETANKKKIASQVWFSKESNLIKANAALRDEYIDGKSAMSFINAQNAMVFAMHDRKEITDAQLEERITTEAQFKEMMDLTQEEELQRLQSLGDAAITFSEVWSNSFAVAAHSLGTLQSMTAELATSMVDTMQQGLQGMFMAIFDKSKKIKDVIKDMGKAMLQSLMTYLSKMIIQTLILGKVLAKIQGKQSQQEAQGMATGAQVAAYRRGWEAAPGWGGWALSKLFLAEATTASQAMVGSIGKYATGTGLAGVPGTGNRDSELALLTPKEIVLNRNESDAYRAGVATGGGSGEPTVVNHIQVNAIDHRDVKEWFEDGYVMLMKESGKARNANKKSLARQGA